MPPRVEVIERDLRGAADDPRELVRVRRERAQARVADQDRWHTIPGWNVDAMPPALVAGGWAKTTVGSWLRHESIVEVRLMLVDEVDSAEALAGLIPPRPVLPAPAAAVR